MCGFIIYSFSKLYLSKTECYILHYEKFADGSVKCIEDEIPFDLPAGWAWTRFSAFTINRDSERKPISLSNRVDVAKIYDYYGASGKIDKIDHFIFDERLLLIGEDGANLVTRTKPIAFFAEGQYWVNNHAHCIDATDKKLLNFVCTYINAIDLKHYVTGSAQPKLSQENMNKILLPIPPIDEQIRIATQIEASTQIIRTIETNNTDLLDCITQAKSKILDLAIRGKLVPQDPTDEPASVLLDRTRTEKEELIKQGKIKRDKKESVIFKGEDNSYYEDIPQNWEEVSLLSIAEVELGKTLDSARNTGEPRDYLRSVNIRWNEIDLSDLKQMKIEPEELERYTVHKGDLLICEGGDVGRCCIWERDTPIIYQNALHRVRFFGSCSPKFFLYYMMYLESLGYLKRVSNGVTIKHLTKNVLASIPFLLPPVAEQYRIVTAIEESFSYLDSVANTLE